MNSGIHKMSHKNWREFVDIWMQILLFFHIRKNSASAHKEFGRIRTNLHALIRVN